MATNSISGNGNAGQIRQLVAALQAYPQLVEDIEAVRRTCLRVLLLAHGADQTVGLPAARRMFARGDVAGVDSAVAGWLRRMTPEDKKELLLFSYLGALHLSRMYPNLASRSPVSPQSCQWFFAMLAAGGTWAEATELLISLHPGAIKGRPPEYALGVRRHGQWLDYCRTRAAAGLRQNANEFCRFVTSDPVLHSDWPTDPEDAEVALRKEMNWLKRVDIAPFSLPLPPTTSLTTRVRQMRVHGLRRVCREGLRGCTSRDPLSHMSGTLFAAQVLGLAIVAMAVVVGLLCALRHQWLLMMIEVVLALWLLILSRRLTALRANVVRVAGLRAYLPPREA